jgi:hypothetical protein
LTGWGLGWFVGAEFEAEIYAQPGAPLARMHEAPYSEAELLSMMERIIEDFGYWRDRGLPVKGHVREDGAYIEIGTPDPARAQHEFRQRYAATPLCFYEKTRGGVPFGVRRGW